MRRKEKMNDGSFVDCFHGSGRLLSVFGRGSSLHGCQKSCSSTSVLEMYRLIRY